MPSFVFIKYLVEMVPPLTVSEPTSQCPALPGRRARVLERQLPPPRDGPGRATARSEGQSQRVSWPRAGT